MAIPTQFSVANTNIAPIANPTLAKDLPKVIEAEEHSLVDGASIIPSLSSVGVSAPQELTAETAVVIANPSAKTAQSKLSVDAPVEKTAESKAAVSAPVEKTAQNKVAVSAPVEKTAQAKAANPAPSVLTPKTGTLTSPPFPLNHARILYKNKLTEAGVITPSLGSGASFTIVPNTYQRWSFNASGSALITYELTSNQLIDTVCIGAHNLEGASVTIRYASVSGGSFTTFGAAQTATKSAMMFHTSTLANVRELRIDINSVSGNKYIGYVSAGDALQMQRPFFNGHQPYTDSDVTEYYSNRTESGEIIGRQIRRKGYETTFEWQNIDDEWYRANIPAFKESAKLRPFFIAWNLLGYPNDVAFGETTGDISTTMQNGTRTKRNGLSFTLKGV